MASKQPTFSEQRDIQTAEKQAEGIRQQLADFHYNARAGLTDDEVAAVRATLAVLGDWSERPWRRLMGNSSRGAL